MKVADRAIVYYSHDVIKHKRLPEIEEDFVRESFGDNTIVFTDTNKLQEYLQEYNYHETNLLMMSSGNFNGVDFFEFSNKIIK